MLIKSLSLENIGHFEHFEMKAGSVVLLNGDNGSGKTTILKSLESVFAGGHSPSLIRIGAPEGRVTLKLDDGTTIDTRIRPKTTERKITTLDGSVVPSPAKYLKTLANGFALNPIGLIEADPKERVPFLLKALQVTFWTKEIAEALGEDTYIAGDGLTLEEFDAYRQGRYVARTEANRKLRDLQGMRRQVSSSMPEEDGQDWAKHAEILSRDLQAKKTELSELLLTAERLRNEETEKIKAQEEAEIEQVRAKYREQVAELHRDANAQVATLRDPLDKDIVGIAMLVSESKVKADAQLKAAGARDALKTIDQNVVEAQSLAATLDRQVEALDALKKTKLDALPIPGVEVRGDKILVNGRDFDTQLNTAEQMKLSLQVASLNTGDLPAMICDRGESLSDVNLQILTDAVKSAGMQLFVARVASGEPLTVSAA